MVQQISRSPGFLRHVLLVDAVATGATALLLVALSGTLAGWLRLPAPLLLGAGLALVPWVAFVAALARRARPGAGEVRILIAGNALWAFGCVALALAGGANALGVAFLLAQALVVAGFAELQYAGLRRGAAPAA